MKLIFNISQWTVFTYSFTSNLPRSNSSWRADKRYLPIYCICISEIDFVRYGWSWKLLFKYLYKLHLGEKMLCASWINQSFSLCFTSCMYTFPSKYKYVQIQNIQFNLKWKTFNWERSNDRQGHRKQNRLLKSRIASDLVTVSGSIHRRSGLMKLLQFYFWKFAYPPQKNRKRKRFQTTD